MSDTTYPLNVYVTKSDMEWAADLLKKSINDTSQRIHEKCIIPEDQWTGEDQFALNMMEDSLKLRQDRLARIERQIAAFGY